MPISLDKVIVLISGFLGILFVWWFFLNKSIKKVVAQNSIDIVVEGGYNPSVIEVQKGMPITFNFLRKDESSCLEEVIIPHFKIKKYLPINQKVSITIHPQKKGEYNFSCGMSMFHGKVIVK